MKKSSSLQGKSGAELEHLLTNTRQDLWNFRFGASGSKARNVKEGRGLRRGIARILTALQSLHHTHKTNAK